MRRYLGAHIPTALIYGLVVVIVGGGWWPVTAQILSGKGLFVAGVVAGSLALFLDRVVYTYSYPKEQLSQQFAWLLKEKRYLAALELLDSRREEQNRLTFRSALFMAVWVPLAFFALTSTADAFGKGVVMGLMFHILLDSWRLQQRDAKRLNERLFFQIGRGVTHEEQLVFMYTMTTIFVFLSWWVR